MTMTALSVTMDIALLLELYTILVRNKTGVCNYVLSDSEMLVTEIYDTPDVMYYQRRQMRHAYKYCSSTVLHQGFTKFHPLARDSTALV